MQFRRFAASAAGVFAAFVSPLIASAHEVYVLKPEEIARAVATPPFSSIEVILANLHSFMFWALLGITVVAGVFLISLSRRLEHLLSPLFRRIRPYATTVSRVTIGAAFLAAAYHGAAYGPELPLEATWGAYAPLIQAGMAIMGLCIIFGVFARTAALAALALFGANAYFQGWYMLTYASYLGQILVLLLIGTHWLGVDTIGKAKGTAAESAARNLHGMLRRAAEALAPASFAILRVCFGIGLLYSAIYAKFLHNQLAFDVANMLLPHGNPHLYSLAHYLGFDPQFLVVGAGIVEVVIALFFILGIEIRFTSLFIVFWLLLSQWYFNESVWPHLVLIGIPIAFIFYGYDKYSVEGWLFKDSKRQPVF